MIIINLGKCEVCEDYIYYTTHAASIVRVPNTEENLKIFRSMNIYFIDELDEFRPSVVTRFLDNAFIPLSSEDLWCGEAPIYGKKSLVVYNENHDVMFDVKLMESAAEFCRLFHKGKDKYFELSLIQLSQGHFLYGKADEMEIFICPILSTQFERYENTEFKGLYLKAVKKN